LAKKIDKVAKRIKEIYNNKENSVSTILPIYPVSIAIYTDSRGTNARVRGNKRYGDYWKAKKDNCYYEIMDYGVLLKDKKFERQTPVSIEEAAIPIGWSAPIDKEGNWKKNPINPETALKSDYTILGAENTFADQVSPVSVNEDPDYLSEWMEEGGI